MNISYKWIREFIDIDAGAQEVADRLTMSGIEVEDVTHVTVPKEIVCARIDAVSKHPDADKLSVCTVDDGTDKIQVVCGAPNVRPGLMSAFAPVGTVLGEGMKVKKTKLRGVESFGILLSEKELGLTDDHSGIFEISSDAVPGQSLADALDIEDWVLDVNVTPNRGDCLSVVGLARELSAIYNADVRYPEFDLVEDGSEIDSMLGVEIATPEGCPRYTARVAENVKLDMSPFTMRRRLFLSGVRAINNVVDITNYVLLEYGQPLHAFDRSLISGGSIVVRAAKQGEKMVTLDSVERSLNEGDVLICDGQRPVALAGIMGGANSEVGDNTCDVVLESAYFDPVHIRKTAKKINLSTEASYRFERGIDPEIQLVAVNRAAYLMKELAGASVATGAIDVNLNNLGTREITLRPSYIKRVLGIDTVDPADVTDIFTRLGCRVSPAGEDFKVCPPHFRHDLEREIDLVEEYIRVLGMDNVEPVLPMYRPCSIVDKGKSERILKYRLASMGLNEIVSYSFISPKWMEWFGTEMMELRNPISDELKYMRTSLVPGLAAAMERNKKQQVRDVFIFEMGRCFIPGTKLPFEEERTAIAISGSKSRQHWSSSSETVDFFDIKGYAQALVSGTGFVPCERAHLEPGIQADVIADGECIGYIGALHHDILSMLDIEDDVFLMEVRTAQILKTEWTGTRHIPKFPSTSRDLSLVADLGVSYEQIRNLVCSFKIDELRDVTPIDTYEGDKLPSGKKGITIRITYQSETRTLADKQINKWQEKIIKSLQEDLSVILRH